MRAIVTLAGIDEAIKNLGYTNDKHIKTRFIKALRQYYSDENSIRAVREINSDDLIRFIWDTDGSDEAIRNKRKNFSSIKSSINSDLLRLHNEGKNPEGVVVGRNNTFDMSDKAKNELLENFTSTATGDGLIPLGKINDVLGIVNDILKRNRSGAGQEDPDDDKKSLDQIKELIQSISQKIGIPGKVDKDAGSGSSSAEETDGGIVTRSKNGTGGDFGEGGFKKFLQQQGNLDGEGEPTGTLNIDTIVSEAEEVEDLPIKEIEDDTEVVGTDEDIEEVEVEEVPEDEDLETEEIEDDTEIVETDEDIEEVDAEEIPEDEVEEIEDDAEIVEADEDPGEVDTDEIPEDDLEEVEEFDDSQELDEVEDEIEEVDDLDAEEVEDDAEIVEADEDIEEINAEEIPAGEVEEVEELDEPQELDEIEDELEEVEELEAEEIEDDVEIIEEDEDLEEVDTDEIPEDDLEEVEELDDSQDLDEAEDELGEVEDLEGEEVEDDAEIVEADEDLEELDAEDVPEDEVEEIEEMCEPLEIDEVEDEVEEVDDLEAEVEDDTEIVEADEDLEEVDAEKIPDDALEEVEELDEPQELEEVEDEVEEVDDLEAEEIEDDAEIIEPDEDLEEVDIEEVPEDDLEEVEELDEPQELDDIDGEVEEVDNFDDTEVVVGDDGEAPAAGEEENGVQKARLLAEEFNNMLSALDRFYNQYIQIPAGKYQIGTKAEKRNGGQSDEVDVMAFYFGVYPVTNALFEIFIEKTGYITTAERIGRGMVYYGRYQNVIDNSTGLKTLNWSSTLETKVIEGACWYQPMGPGSTLYNKRNHPVVQVSHEDAMAFAAWTGKRLPSEAQWEAATRTLKANKYPWGNVFKEGRCNLEDSYIGDTTPVDKYAGGKNSYGIMDTLGNVMEWTVDKHKTPAQERHTTSNIVKGGSWISGSDLCLYDRILSDPASTSNILGFRCIT